MDTALRDLHILRRYHVSLSAYARVVHTDAWGAYWSLFGGLNKPQGYHSPGICPGGFSLACTRSGDFGRALGPEVLNDETAMLCAPRYDALDRSLSLEPLAHIPFTSGYTCNGYVPHHAVSIAGTSFLTLPFIQIRWRSSDLAVL